MANTIEDLYGKNGSLRVKDLFERLPYGIFVLLPDTEEEAVVFTADYHPNWFKARAYLRPMSSMTEEERIEFSRLLDRRYCEEDWEGHISTSYCIEVDSVYTDDEDGIKYPSPFSMKAIDWLIKNYFDYRGLIEIGEAIEAPKGMYVSKAEKSNSTKEYDVDVTMVYNGIMRVKADSEDEALEKAEKMLDVKGLKNAPNEIEIPNGTFHFGEATADYATPAEE